MTAAGATRRAFVLVWLSVTLTASAAVTVYRCGSSYADVPCPRAIVTEVDDARSDADRAAAQAVALRERLLAASMVADRERAERTAPAPRPVRAKSPARAASAPAARTQANRARPRVDADGNFVAVVPRGPRR